MQCVRGRYSALFSPATNTMPHEQLWQQNVVGEAHYIMDCFQVLGALDDAPDDAPASTLISPGGWADSIQTITHTPRLTVCTSRHALLRTSPHLTGHVVRHQDRSHA